MIVLDDNIEDHPKFAGLTNDAFALWVRCLGYCRRCVTDGFIPVAVVHARARIVKPSRAVGELTRVAPGCSNPLWWEVPGGYQIHDYTEWNPSKEQVDAKLEKLREKGRKGGLRSGQVRGERASSEPEAKHIASTKDEARCFDSRSTQTNPGPVRSGPVRSEISTDPLPPLSPPENPRPAPAAAALVERREPESTPSPPPAGLADAIGLELERHAQTRGLDAAQVQRLAFGAFERKLGPAGVADGIAWAAEKLATESVTRAAGSPLSAERVITLVLSGFKGTATKRNGKPDERPAPPVKPKRKDLEPIALAEQPEQRAANVKALLAKVGNGGSGE